MAELTERQKRQIAGAVAEVDPAQIAASRHLTIAQKIKQALSMIEFAEEVAAYRLRQRQPHMSEALSLLTIRKATTLKESATTMSTSDLSFREFARVVLDTIRSLELEYLIGGAVAAWAWGEARTTRDFDLVIDLPPHQIRPFSEALKREEMLVPPEIILDLLLSPVDLPINAIHMPTGFKAEFFLVRPDDALRQSAFHRRLIADLGYPLGEAYVHSPEDLILYKLQYYKLGQQPKHIRDIASILLTIGKDIEMDYIQHWIETLDLVAVWQEIQNEIHREG
ncbi:MAG: hypothetical protein KF893_27365 [Caldilineaceae bacterium]|nr:hypothetical protein [Caldilineaceae bacterium]